MSTPTISIAHSALAPADGIHGPHSWAVVDEAQRLALAVTSEDIGKIARQGVGALTTEWMLVGVAPAAWKERGAKGADGLTSSTVAVNASRNLTAADNGKVLELTAVGIALTVPTGLGAATFGCQIVAKAGATVVSAGGSLLNDGTATVTLGAGIFRIVGKASAPDSYAVSIALSTDQVAQVGNKLTPKLLNVGTRCRTPTTIVTAKSFQSESKHFVRETCAQLLLRMPNFAGLSAGTTPTGSGETAPGGAVTFNASVVKADGTIYPATATGVAADGSTVFLAVNGSWKDGELVTVKGYGVTSGTQMCFASSAPALSDSNAVMGDALNFSGSVLPDLTGSATAVAHSAPAGIYFFPDLIVALTTKPSFEINADSRPQGLNDKQDSSGDIGYWERIIGPRYGYTNCSVQGEQGLTFSTSNTNRLAACAFVSDRIDGYGVNDARSGGKTAAQILGYDTTSRAAAAAINPALRQWKDLPFPYTTSGNGWTTELSGSPDQVAGSLAVLNGLAELYRRNRYPLLTGYLDTHRLVSPYLNSGLLRVPKSQPIVTTGSVTGSVLTISSNAPGPITPYAIGMLVTYPGQLSGLWITSFGSGSGSTGTYNLNAAVGTPSGSVTITLYNVNTYDGLHLNFNGVQDLVDRQQYLRQMGYAG